MRKEILEQLSENTWRLSRYTEEDAVTDIIEGPLIFVLNDYVLRSTGLRIYRDRRRKQK